MLGVDKLAYKARAFESLTIVQALNSSSNCKVAIIKVLISTGE